jgi:AcrR family transcriptional regulator
MVMARISRAERKEQTRMALVEAADRVFTREGFHGATLDQVAAEAGFTKGAVYSNFRSKEDLFFGVYERRVARSLAVTEQVLAEAGPEGPVEVARQTLARRTNGDDGWLAVFYEFWAHVIRHPELRERFLELHVRGRRPMEQAAAQWLESHGRSSDDAEQFTLAVFALVSGIGLEQLTDPRLDGAAVLDGVFHPLIGG